METQEQYGQQENGLTLDLREPVYCQKCRTPIHTLTAVPRESLTHSYTVQMLCENCKDPDIQIGTKGDLESFVKELEE